MGARSIALPGPGPRDGGRCSCSGASADRSAGHELVSIRAPRRTEGAGTVRVWHSAVTPVTLRRGAGGSARCRPCPSDARPQELP
ncbi:hypothetical protein FM110_06585 [Brachybacterium nesterenkovii]|uniref:Uncharacterized protein n=1 Tax=Brachybacterium nesterenkovii TaxID=47847 RepID=A0A1X6WZZ0_9MICO|nr:hypothetical protein FM110_06585 [Brachybacterium nesterenkovii]